MLPGRSFQGSGTSSLTGPGSWQIWHAACPSRPGIGGPAGPARHTYSARFWRQEGPAPRILARSSYGDADAVTRPKRVDDYSARGLEGLTRRRLSRELGPVQPWQGPGLGEEGGTSSQADSDELTIPNFLGALHYLAKHKQQLNPAEVSSTLEEALPLLPQMTPEQLVHCLKSMAAAGVLPPRDFFAAALTLLQPKLREVDLVELGHLSWALVAMAQCPPAGQGPGIPLVEEQQQLQQQLPPGWLDAFLAATQDVMLASNQQEQQQEHRRLRRLPIQALVHVLLLPSVLGVMPRQLWWDCYFATLQSAGLSRGSAQDVAQLLASLTRLAVSPCPGLLQQILDHFEEDHWLYDTQQLAQLVLGFSALQLSPSREWVDLLVSRVKAAADRGELGHGEEHLEAAKLLVVKAESLIANAATQQLQKQGVGQ